MSLTTLVIVVLVLLVVLLGALLRRARRQPPIDRPPVIADPPRIRYLTDAAGVMLKHDASKPLAAAKRADALARDRRRLAVKRSGITRRATAPATPAAPAIDFETARRKRA